MTSSFFRRRYGSCCNTGKVEDIVNTAISCNADVSQKSRTKNLPGCQGSDLSLSDRSTSDESFRDTRKSAQHSFGIFLNPEKIWLPSKTVSLLSDNSKLEDSIPVSPYFRSSELVNVKNPDEQEKERLTHTQDDSHKYKSPTESTSTTLVNDRLKLGLKQEEAPVVDSSLDKTLEEPDVLKKMYPEIYETVHLQFHHQVETLQMNLNQEIQKRQKAEIFASIRQKQYQEILQHMTVCEEILNWFKERYPNHLNLDEFKSKSADQLIYNEKELFRMQKIIENMTFEKELFQKILIQKDKELVALKNMDPTFKSLSVFELTTKAVSLLQESKQSEQIISNNTAQLEDAKEKINELQEAINKLKEQLDKTRTEKTSALSLLEKCNIRLGNLEVELEERKIQENISKKEDAVVSNRQTEQYLRLVDELDIATEQLAKFRDELAYRDKLIVTLKSEIVRQSIYNQNAEARILYLSKCVPKPANLQHSKKASFFDNPTHRLATCNKSISVLSSRKSHCYNSHVSTSPRVNAHNATNHTDSKNLRSTSTLMCPTQSSLKKRVSFY
ncbi:uncharacterized protein LOC128884068 isoform X2 [Hylaeus volcanicus]|uniref:uncharacterized protein LOC128884068 isoform X2 n=1 Tax=Hylaeus volcanicus TaxID=313075 RepID=UPI0023B84166|nr:uncharacterized protein LOC128884068 isoform X2 [Hylaeus volcanicus]